MTDNEASASTVVMDEYEFYIPPYFLYGILSGFVGVFVSFYLMKDVLVPNLTSNEFQTKVSKLKRKEKNFFYITLPSLVHSIAHSIFHPMYISVGLYTPEEYTNNRVTYFDPKFPAYFQGIFVG